MSYADRGPQAVETVEDLNRYITVDVHRISHTYLPNEDFEGGVTQKKILISKNQNQPLIRRMFGKMEEGSLRGSIISLMNFTLGAGMLSLPYVVGLGGFVLGGMFIILGAFISFQSSIFLSDAQYATKAKNYSDLIVKTMGNAWARLFQIIIIIYLVGATVGYFIIFATDVQQILYTYFISPEKASEKWIWYTLIGSLTLCMIPFVLKKKITELRYVSVIGCLAAVYISILMVVLTPFYIQNEFYPKKYSYFNFDINIFDEFAVTVFAYACQQIVLPVKLEMTNPTPVRVFKVFRRSTLGVMTIYGMVAILGYVCAGNNIPQIITELPPMSPSSYNIAMNIAVIFMIINMFASIPLQQAPGRDQILHSFKLENNRIAHILVSLGYLFLCTLLAMFFQNLYEIFSILGGFGGSFMIIFYPGVCRAITLWNSDRKKAYFILIYTGIFSTFGFIAAILTTLNIIGVIEIGVIKNQEKILFQLLVNYWLIICKFIFCLIFFLFYKNLYCLGDGTQDHVQKVGSVPTYPGCLSHRQ